MRRSAGKLFLDNPWALIIVAGFIAFGYWAYTTRVQSHELRAGFATAVQLFPGQDVRIAGLDAGKVTSVEYEGGQAVVGLGIDDESVWPLHEGTRAVIKLGTTVGNGTRYVTLYPGPKTAPEIPDGGIITTENTASPVEFDDVFNMFNTATRERLQSMVGHTANTLGGRERALQSGLRHTPPAFEATAGLFAELASDQEALQSLITNTSRTTRIIARRDDDIRSLITGAAQTMDAFADQSEDLGTNIEQFEGTLRETRTTLARVDDSVDVLDGLIADIGPGARALRPFAAAARPTLRDLRLTVPDGLGIIREMDRNGPDITRMLRRLQPFSNDLAPVLRRFAPQLACVRPWAPELAGFFTTWNNFSHEFDSNSHYPRTRPQGGPEAFTSYPDSVTSDQFVNTINPGAKYAFPRVPGLNAGRPQFIPECGYTPDALDPTQDPEDPGN